MSPTKSGLRFGGVGLLMTVLVRLLSGGGTTPYYYLYAAFFIVLWTAVGYYRPGTKSEESTLPDTIGKGALIAIEAGLLVCVSMWVLLFLAAANPRDGFLAIFLGVSTAMSEYQRRRRLKQNWKTIFIAPVSGAVVALVAQRVIERF